MIEYSNKNRCSAHAIEKYCQNYTHQQTVKISQIIAQTTFQPEFYHQNTIEHINLTMLSDAVQLIVDKSLLQRLFRNRSGILQSALAVTVSSSLASYVPNPLYK